MMRFLFLLSLVGAQTASAQGGRDSLTKSTLSMDEAIAIARRNNPDFLQTVNNRHTASAAVRSAYGALLPTADASLAATRQQSGQQIVSGSSLGASSDINQSSYRIGFGYRLNSATLITPSLQRANKDAVEADITGAAQMLRDNVARQYLTALQAEARADLQDSLLVAAQAQRVLAQAREIVGSGTQLDVQRAEVTLGQQQVAILQARNQIEIEKLKLFQIMGVQQPANVRLVTNLEVRPTTLSLQELLESAHRQNPVVLALRSRKRVAELNVRRERGEYSPTLSLSTGIGGYTYGYVNDNFPVAQAQASTLASKASCIRTEEVRAALSLSNNLASCSAISFTDAQAAALRTQNSKFPFNFTRAPRSITAALSLPLFDGFAREERVQQAIVAREDAQLGIRSRELGLNAEVTGAYLTLTTAEKTVALQQQNSAKAKQELTLVQERYRVGATTYVDVMQARADYERAENDRINAVYDYHKAFAALESAVGHPLR
ncbi:MAG: TolC family protein [Gemmatimonadaceae bacterium]|nr:TolC family protein [Gemmatimonadaceae bacterium]